MFLFEDMRSRHSPVRSPFRQAGSYPLICGSDRYKWPCHAHVAFAAIDAVLKQADSAREVRDCSGYETGGRLVGWNLSPARVREAIRRELLGKDAADGG